MVEAWPDMIVVMALPLESQGRFERAGAPVLFTGLGKVNAAYALAKVCALEEISFACAKYITDGADHAAANDWQGNLPQAAAEFFTLYRRLVTPQQA